MPGRALLHANNSSGSTYPSNHGPPDAPVPFHPSESLFVNTIGYLSDCIGRVVGQRDHMHREVPDHAEQGGERSYTGCSKLPMSGGTRDER